MTTTDEKQRCNFIDVSLPKLGYTYHAESSEVRHPSISGILSAALKPYSQQAHVHYERGRASAVEASAGDRSGYGSLQLTVRDGLGVGKRLCLRVRGERLRARTEQCRKIGMTWRHCRHWPALRCERGRS